MFDVKGVDIKIEIPVPEDFNTIKDSYNLIFDGMLPTVNTYFKVNCYRHIKYSVHYNFSRFR